MVNLLYEIELIGICAVSPPLSSDEECIKGLLNEICPTLWVQCIDNDESELFVSYAALLV
jgi:hypothetical protein